MICLQEVKKYCQEYYLIENYGKAVADESQTWHCHHRHEIEYNLSKMDLQAMGFYFNRPFYELIFLTPYEHNRLHNSGENNSMYGKHHTEETKSKISAANKGKESSMRGKHHTEEAKEKMRDVRKNTRHTEETKQKISNANKGKPKSEEWKQKMTKIHIAADKLYDLYVVQELSTCKIAKIYNCNPETIRGKLKKFNIKKSN